MRHVKFLDLSAQHAAIRNELDAAIDDVLTHSSFIGGKWVSKFEEAFADYVGAKHCIGVANGTDALEIILRCIDVQKISVIVPAFTAPPTAEAVTSAGGHIVFADCNAYFLISTTHAEFVRAPKANVLLPVHLYGNACDMDALARICNNRHLDLVEDCCQAHGTRYNGRHVGTFGLAGAFSFYPSKNLGALGDAGAIVTNFDGVAEYCRAYANHGRSPEDKNIHNTIGRNSRLDALQAAVLCVKLNHLDKWIARRREVAAMYYNYLPYCVQVPGSSPQVDHSYHIYAIKALRRNELKTYLASCGIETMVHYPLAVPDQPAYQQCPFMLDSYARLLAYQTLSLPIGPHVVEDDVAYVAECIERFYDD